MSKILCLIKMITWNMIYISFSIIMNIRYHMRMCYGDTSRVGYRAIYKTSPILCNFGYIS